MGADIREKNHLAIEYFERANEILDYDLTKIMLEDPDEVLRRTCYAQPAIFLHSVILAKTTRAFKPDMVAGHSLGEFSALVSNRALSFGDGLRLVQERANAMQTACEAVPSTMAAVLGLEDDIVEEVCNGIDEVVVAANYNSPEQLVISGSLEGIKIASEKLMDAGARRCITLKVAGAFHSPIMEPAKEQFAAALEKVAFRKPICPIYQNVDAMPTSDVEVIKANLIKQITAPVMWKQTILNMAEEGAREFIEIGPKPVLSGMVRKITGREITTSITN
ncbi:UNVERIFIED_CONTAM: hypothetical protein GTU68_052791 [Idotea baltica]|nr:hypothetical protein [Idotea baltica]